MDEPEAPNPRSTPSGPPRRRRWRWMAVRLAVVAVVLFVFRYHIVAWMVRGHNAAWRAATGSADNCPGDVRILSRLRRPGADGLIAMGEFGALAQVRDPDMIPTLIGLARSHDSLKVRAYALWGLSDFRDERIPELATALLSDPDSRMRRVAAEVLGDVGEPRHAPILRHAALKEKVASIRHTLEGAAIAVEGQGAAPDASGRKRD